MLKHVKSLFPLGAHTHVATLTSMWRPLSCSQYGTSASHGAKPRIMGCTCSFPSDSGSSQTLQKDFKVKIQTFWTQLQIDSVHVFIIFFFFFWGAQKWLILWFITAKADQRNPKWFYLTRYLLFFFVSTKLNIQCGFFQSISGLIQRLGHPWMKRHTPEIPQEEHWSWQAKRQPVQRHMTSLWSQRPIRISSWHMQGFSITAAYLNWLL